MRRAMLLRRIGLALAALVALLLGLLGWAAFAPVVPGARDTLFEIPPGTWARRMAGEPVEILPDTIHLTLGLNDTLLLRNRDNVPQVFGPVLIMPGQDFRLPFAQAAVYSFSCTAHASGQMRIIVDPAPLPGWQTLQWRLDHWLQALTQRNT